MIPSIQAIRYPAGAGQDVCYGLRLIIPFRTPSSKSSFFSRGTPATCEATRRDWSVEIGKIPDDSLRSHLVANYVGLADNFYYFRVETPEQSTTLLASLFLADLITRDEADSVLSKGPHHPDSVQSSSLLNTTIHRLPSLATLGGAYWAGSSATAELLSSSTLLAGASATALAMAPVGVGCLAVGGAMLLFSRSSQARGHREQEDEVDRGLEMVLWRREESDGMVRRREQMGVRTIDVRQIHVLSDAELEANPIFARPSRGFNDAVRRLAILPSPSSSDAFIEPPDKVLG